jgi:hypothetical protein
MWIAYSVRLMLYVASNVDWLKLSRSLQDVDVIMLWLRVVGMLARVLEGSDVVDRGGPPSLNSAAMPLILFQTPILRRHPPP